MLAKISIWLIQLYQSSLSPDHGWFREAFPFGYCKFKPTCSEYTKQAIQKYGFWKGWRLGLWRIMRCNPWGRGGEDPIR